MLIEVIGVAGSGKSTLCGSLKSQNPKMSLSPKLARARMIHWIFVYTMLHGWKIFLKSKKGSFSSNLKLYLHMKCTLRELKKKSSSQTVFDQGIIYQFASYKYFGFGDSSSEYLTSVFDDIVKTYLCYLNILVYLKIQDTLALERVSKRSSYHMLNDFSELNKADFIAYYQDYYDSVVQIAGQCGCKVVEVDTSYKTPDQVKEIVSLSLAS
ncbi:hypothetical protein A3752_10760 [Oleiphilus sp. HI0081]|nr:hypothetical protein A3743_04275 [Oleiphilus sp. HI0072]KZZ20779.1 hypothetical protein A3752_10760 [Oleiphilus sp. HI0081]